MVTPLGRDGQAVQLPREADREIADVDHLLDLAEALGEDLAAFERDKAAERLLVRPQRLAEPADEFAAARGRHHAPVLEGGLRATDGSCDVGRRGGVHAPDQAAVDRGGRVEIAGARRDPEPVEQPRRFGFGRKAHFAVRSMRAMAAAGLRSLAPEMMKAKTSRGSGDAGTFEA